MASLDDIVGGADAGDDGDDAFDVDFSGAVEFGKLSGKYPAVIVEAAKGQSKEGNPKIEVKFEIVGPNEKGEDATGAKRTRHCPTTGKGSGIAKQVIKAAGFDVSDPKMRFTLKQLVGKPVFLVMGDQKDSEEYDEIKRVEPRALPAAIA